MHLITGYAGYQHIKSEDDGAFNASFFGNGQFVMEDGDRFEASIIDNNTVRISDGNGMMYGRHFRIPKNTYEDMTISTGTAGKNRTDLICVTYERNESTGVEQAYLEVIKGTESAGTPPVPTYTNGNILDGAKFNQMPLYKVTINGVVLSAVEAVFTLIPTYKELAEMYAAEYAATINTLKNNSILDTVVAIKANKKSNMIAGALALKEHLENKENPHGVTKTQVGLGSVDNTSDKDKPISDATRRALELLDIQTTKDNTLYGTKPGGARLLGMKGNTEQKTYNGYQLFDASKLPTHSAGGATVTNNGDGSFTVSGSGESTDIFSISYTYSHDDTVALLKNGKCTLVADSVGNPYVYMMLRNSDTSLFTLSNYNKATTSIEITQDMLNDESVCLRIGLYMDKGTTITPGTIKPMLYQDGDGTWEPFVGGTQSPNPEYKQSLNHTGDCVEMIQGGHATNTGAYSNTYTDYICSKYRIPCKESDVINVTLDNDIITSTMQLFLYDKDGNFIKQKPFSNTNTINFTVPTNIKYFHLDIKKPSNNDPENVKISLTVNGKYVTQIHEHWKNFVKVGKNYTVNGITYTVNADKSITANGTATGGAMYDCKIFLKAGKYVVSGCPSGGTNSTYRIMVVDSISGEHIVSDFGNGATFTLTEDKWVICYTGRIYTGITVSNLTFHTMIREDGTDPTYEPYTEHIATIYTDEPVRKGDIVKKIDGLWQVERNVAEVVFDGTKTINVANANQYYIDLDTNAYSDAYQPCYCSHFIGSPKGAYNVTGDNLVSVSSTKIWIYSTSFATNTDLNTYILEQYADGTPVTLEYPLATPTYEILDTASQLALNSLKTFNGVTYIEVDSRVQPEECEWEYGTSQVGAYALQALNEKDTDKVERAELKAELEELRVAMLAMGSEV